MSALDQQPPPDFDEDFLQALTKWREQHKIKDDDTILVLMDLFRIHQTHWDELRRRQMPSLDEFKDEIAVLVEATKLLKERASRETRVIDLSTALWAVIAATVSGYLFGKLL